MQPLLLVIQAEEQRSDGLVFPVLVPAETRDDTVGRPDVLDLDHRALARLVRRAGGLGHHAVQPRPFEARQPLERLRAVARHRGQMD